MMDNSFFDFLDHKPSEETGAGTLAVASTDDEPQQVAAQAQKPQPLQAVSLAPKPQTLQETGLEERFLAELVTKHLYSSGVQTLRQLVEKLALRGSIIEPLLHFLRKEALVEILGQQSDQSGIPYTLTDRGRHVALDAINQRGYVGPAPITLDHYRHIVAAQSIHQTTVTRSSVDQAYESIVVRKEILDQMGPAVISGRSIFIYGPAGTGKTYLSQRLCRLFGDSCLIPHALYVNEQVVQLFDPLIHHQIAEEAAVDGAHSMRESGHDPRFALCQRPVVITGGELSMDMLDIFYDAATREYRAPLQLKANNGIFIIDDMGRQHASPKQIFNRWIVPLEDKHDYLSLGAGRHFQTPFDQVLVFSSNINPLELADEAFLRRIGYKIHFSYVNPQEYEEIWLQVCAEKNIKFVSGLVDFVINDLHRPRQVPLCPCHPRDLLGIAMDRLRFQGQESELTPELMTWAWNTYFVRMDEIIN
ncbi:MAG: AAA family ATPase [Motiliproteus sp.]